MATYTITLTPALRNLATEGGLDTALVAGKSVQRTGYIEVKNGTSRKIVLVKDGDTFNDTMATITSYPGLTIS